MFHVPCAAWFTMELRPNMGADISSNEIISDRREIPKRPKYHYFLLILPKPSGDSPGGCLAG
jgi:hypothetical protein